MGLEKKTKTIDGIQFDVTTLDAYGALPVWDKVAKILIPTIDELGKSGAALAMLAGGVDDLMLISRIATRAGAIAIEKLSASDLRYCIDAFAAATDVHIDTRSPKLTKEFAGLFAGKLTSMWKWFAFCLEVNFSDFLDEARSILKRAQQEQNAKDAAKRIPNATESSPSPVESTGASSA